MSEDKFLSQDEVDALLNSDNSNEDSSNDEEKQSSIKGYLSNVEEDALGEVGNISFSSAATVLSTLLNQKVDITTPEVSLVKQNQLAEEFPKPHVAVSVKYTEGFQGSNVFVIKMEDAAIIADLMLGGDGTNPSGEIGDIQLSAVQEAMNQMMGSASTSMSTIFNKKVDISPPEIDLMDVKEGKGTDKIHEQDEYLKVSFRLKVGDLIDSSIMQFLPVDFGKELVHELLHPNNTKSDVATGDNEPEKQPEQKQTEPIVAQQKNSDPAASERQEPQHLGSRIESDEHQGKNIQSAAFDEFDNTREIRTESQNMDMLFDIPLQVSVELGRTRRTVKEILDLSAGSIIELDKLAGEPVDILLNNKMVAKGEVVVIDENFGVRVTDIASKQDRIQKLN